MSAIPWLLVIAAAAACLYLYWDEHPAVRLKRQIKERLRSERQAQEELDAAHQLARNDLERLADWWDGKP